MTIAAIDFQLLANAGFPPATFAPGDVIFAKGEKGDKMYVIRSGSRSSGTSSRRCRGGYFRGDGLDRRIAEGRHGTGEVAPVTEKSFLFLVHETPFFAIAGMRTLAERLRRAA